jgi:hypothetical protein
MMHLSPGCIVPSSFHHTPSVHHSAQHQQSRYEARSFMQQTAQQSDLRTSSPPLRFISASQLPTAVLEVSKKPRTQAGGEVNMREQKDNNNQSQQGAV